jgi:phytoene synthase
MAETPAQSPLAAFVRQHDPDRFLCALFAPVEARETLFALIAFNHELARAREAAREPMMVLIRLQWWRDAVEEAAAGQPPRRHEVAEPLAAELREGRLDAAALLAMIEAREADETGQDAVPLLQRLRGTAGGMAVETGRLLGAPPGMLEGLRKIGTAYGVGGTLRSLGALAASGREPFPPGTPPKDAAQSLAEQGLSILRAGRSEVVGLPSRAIAAALPAVLAGRDLRAVLSPGWEPGAQAMPRRLGDRLAVSWAGWRGRI